MGQFCLGQKPRGILDSCFIFYSTSYLADSAFEMYLEPNFSPSTLLPCWPKHHYVFFGLLQSLLNCNHFLTDFWCLTLSLNSLFLTRGSTVTTQVRSCHSSAQNPLMSCHLTQSKSQKSYDGLQDSTWPTLPISFILWLLFSFLLFSPLLNPLQLQWLPCCCPNMPGTLLMAFALAVPLYAIFYP